MGTLVEPVETNGVPAEWVTPAGVAGGRVLLYLHGGAYQIGSPATLRHMIALLCGVARARALSVDYRLAPEHPFPAAVDDAVAAYRWLLAAGTDPATIAIAGIRRAAAWRWRRWRRCGTRAIRCPRLPCCCRPGRTWR